MMERFRVFPKWNSCVTQPRVALPKQVVGLILSKRKKRPYVWPTIEEMVIWLSVFDLPNRLEWFGSHATNSMEGCDLEKIKWKCFTKFGLILCADSDVCSSS